MSRRVNALVLIMIMAVAPLIPMASAHSEIGLSTDVNHIILSPGEATNLTLTIDNNGSSIESYNITVSGFDEVWEIIPADSNVSNVIPTFSASTTIAVRLATTAHPDDSGTLVITVTEPDANISSQIQVQLSVLPRYLPSIDASTAGDNGLVSMDPGDSANLSILVTNNGNVDDTILLSVDQGPDLAAFWSNWSSGGGSNNTNGNSSGNNSGNNSTGGNSTGGNSTGGNSTGGNSTGGNSTGGNSTGGNSTGGNSTGGNSTGGNSTGGNSTGGVFSKSGHSSWEVRFNDDLLDVMNPGESRTADLRISIPDDLDPGYYGFTLFAASALGNFSVNTTLVVNVTATHDLSFSHSTDGKLLPGENTTAVVDITSLSNADANWTFEAMVMSGDCSIELPILQANIMKDDSYDLDIIISAGVNSHVNDECEIKLTSNLDHDSSISEEYMFTISVDESWGLSMVIPEAIKLDVDTAETFNIAISNDGTENDTVSIMGIDSEGITFTNPDPVMLERGESQYVVMEVMISPFVVGDITLNFTMSSTKSGSSSVNDSGIFEVKEYAELSLTGPQDNRIVIVPGQNSSIIVNISNDGTKDLDLTSSINGLPNGITVVRGLESLTLESGESIDLELEFEASNGLQPMSNDFTLEIDGGWTSATLTLELQVTDRRQVLVDSSEDRLIASPLGDSNITIMVTNLGTSTETFVAEINNSEVSDWFTISVDKLSLTLDSGQSGNLVISAREIATGAPNTGAELMIKLTSSADSTVSDSITIDVIPQIANGIITVTTDKDNAKPGESIFGNVIITNTGTAEDTMRINTIEMDCNLDDVEVTLSPSMSSSSIPWSCTVGEEKNAGMKVLTFRLTSSARSDMIITQAKAYAVDPTWDDEVISFSFDKNDLKFDRNDEQQTISLTICNQANLFVSGDLEHIGKNSNMMDVVFFRAGEKEINTSYSLENNQCQDFRVQLMPLDLDGFEASIEIRAVSTVSGQEITDNAPEIRVDVEGPEMPPDGLNLGLIELDNKNSIILLSTGWVLSILLIMYIRLFRKPAEVEEEEEEEEEIPLGPNEVRIDEYNKVTCTSCDARLGVPEGSEPPFRFTCPKCETRIRVVE